MSTEFNETTERKAEDHSKGCAYRGQLELSFTAGRNSTKESLEISCRSMKYLKEEIETLVEKYGEENGDEPYSKRSLIILKKYIEGEIKKVKARGDWPLEDK
jgi:hypothetical protein